MKHGGYGGTHLGSRKSSSGPSRTVAIPSPAGGSCASTTSTGTTTCRSPTDAASESASHQKGEEAGSPQNDGSAVIAKRAATPGGGRHHANTVGAQAVTPGDSCWEVCALGRAPFKSPTAVTPNPACGHHSRGRTGPEGRPFCGSQRRRR